MQFTQAACTRELGLLACLDRVVRIAVPTFAGPRFATKNPCNGTRPNSANQLFFIDKLFLVREPYFSQIPNRAAEDLTTLSLLGERLIAMASSQDFNSLQEAIQKSLVSTVKSANRIASQDLSFQRTVNPDVAEQLDEKTSRILDLSTRLLSSAAQACGLKSIKLEDPEDVDMNWRAVVDVVDSILEKADRAIDEYTGLVKQRENGDSDSVRLPQTIYMNMTLILIAKQELQDEAVQVNRQGCSQRQCKEAAVGLRNPTE